MYSSAGQWLRASAGTSDRERISLAGLEPGEYYIRVYSYTQQPSSSYSLTLNLPTADITPDSLEANQTLQAATDLRIVGGVTELESLSIHDSTDVDWFRFETISMGTAVHFAGLVFNGSLGDLDLELYDAQGGLLRQSSSTSDTELISLSALDAGVYFLKVLGFRVPRILDIA